MGKPALPRHGTLRRYRLELKAGQPCDKCRAANSQAKATERANRKARDNRAQLKIVGDPQTDPTPDPTKPAAETKRTVIHPGVQNMVGGGIENAVRNYLNAAGHSDLLAHVYGEIVIAVSRVIAVSDPKDIPKLTEEMVDAAKLMKPENAGGGSDDPFAGLGQAT